MSDSEGTDFEDFEKRCNYCNNFNKLVFGKPYCLKCKQNCFRECRRCHKPYHEEKFFAQDQNRCNSCFNKLLKEREKRQQKRQRECDNATSSSEAKRIAIEKEKASEDIHAIDIAKHLPSGDNSEVKMGFIPIYFK